jgi:nicotinamidase-related amidase
MAKRIFRDHCCGVLIDVQDGFLAQLDKAVRAKVESNTRHLVNLLGYFRIPVVATIERPLDRKGALPREISRRLSTNDLAVSFEKDFYDLTRQREIRDHLAGLNRKQMIVAGCETDVCILQSCLGLRQLGYEVYVVEELLFSSSSNVETAIARMKAEGAVFLSYKSLHYELCEAVPGSRHEKEIVEAFGRFPKSLPDSAA